MLCSAELCIVSVVGLDFRVLRAVLRVLARMLTRIIRNAYEMVCAGLPRAFCCCWMSSSRFWNTDWSVMCQIWLLQLIHTGSG